MIPNRTRDLSIDILKFFAVFLIINSHMDICYPKYSMLATGGAIGDCLFLFASGYTLFLGKMSRFDNWYKRRINRIYPSALSCAMVAALIKFDPNIPAITIGGGQFVLFIMLYYILLYLIQKFAINKIPIALAMVAIASLAVYILWFPYKYETSSKGIYGISTLYRWIPYFGFMLLGAWIGLQNKNRDKKSPRTWVNYLLFIMSLGIFYGIQFGAKRHIEFAPYQIVTLIPLAGIVYYFYKICNAEVLEKLYNTKIGYAAIMTVSGLCLESYLIQNELFTDKMNGIFPLNIPIMMTIVIIVSYLCRCLARIFSQTFAKEDYDWVAVFKLY